jgi:YD repeat-containing protein
VHLSNWLARLCSQIQMSRPAGRNRQRDRRSATVSRIEALESRLLLSAVNWDGGGDGTHWSDPLNWSSDVLPVAADDVTINFGAATIDHAGGDDTIHSLNATNNFALSGGTLTINANSVVHGDFQLSNGTLDGAGDLSLSGAVNWTSGEMVGTGRTIVAAGGTLNLNTPGVKNLDRVLENDGAGTWTEGEVRMSGGTFLNKGTFTVDSASPLLWRVINDPSNVENIGTFIKHGAGQAELRVNFSNSGTVNVQDGTLLVSRGGTQTGHFNMAAGATFETIGDHIASGVTTDGPGTFFVANELAIGGTLFVNGDSTFHSGFTLGGGALGGTAKATLSGMVNWMSGDMVGAGQTVIAAGGTLNLSTQGVKNLDRVLENDGVGTWTEGEFRMADGTFLNIGTFTADSDATLVSYGTSGTNEVDNTGTFIKHGAGQTEFRVNFSNSGTVNVQDGTLLVSRGGTQTGHFNMAAGATLETRGEHVANGMTTDGAGTFLVVSEQPVGGTLFVNGDSTFRSGFTLSGGALGGTATANLAGAVNWTRGEMVGTGRTIVTAEGTLSISTPGVKDLDRVLENDGAGTWTEGDFRMAGGTFLNIGTFTADSDSTLVSYGTSGTNEVDNRGTFTKLGAGVEAFSMHVDNSGTVNVQEGTFRFNGGATSTGKFHTGFNGTLQIAEFPILGTLVADGDGTVLFFGVGSGSAPQIFEVASQDLGPIVSGFNHNSALGVLSLVSSNVRLINLADNSPGAGAEALYVNNVLVDGSSNLDLNSLHTYTRITQVAGQVTGGTLSILKDGGEIEQGLPTPGAITASGEKDEWTIFGRAGQTLTIQANPGLSVQPAPVAPALVFAQVRLLDPDGHVIATAESTSAGQIASLYAVTLPTDGTYRIQIGAPADHSDSQGNYVLSVWNATSDINSLEVNQQVFGNVENPFSVDHWNLTASAGQQVQFDLIASASNGVGFDLLAPDNSTLFSDLAGDSDLLTLPVSGVYKLVAHSLEGASGAYSFEIDATTQSILAPNSTLPGTLIGTGDAHLYRIDVPQSNSLLVALDDSTNSDHNELYLRFGEPPTREDYDARFSASTSGDQSILIPNAKPGAWYALVYGAFVPAASSFSIKATVANLIVTASTPGQYATNNTVAMTVTGGGFTTTSQVSLIAANSTVFPASSLFVDSSAQVTATFNLQGVPIGVYSVRVDNPDGESTTLANAFTVTADGQAHLETHLILPELVGRHAASTFYVQYANTGNVAMPAPVLTLQSADPDGSDNPLLTLDQSKVVQNLYSNAIPDGFSHSIQIYASGATPGILQPGESISVPVYYAGLLLPYNFDDTSVELEVRVQDAGSTEVIDWASLKSSLKPSWIAADAWDAVYSNLTDEIGTTWGDYLSMLSDNAIYLGRLGLNITNVNDLYSFELQQALGFSPVSVVATATDASIPAPGLPLEFSRTFGNTITERYQTGPFGRGWPAPTWQISLTQLADGTAVVHQSADAERRFQPDSRYQGRYFAQTGDPGVLHKASDGTFTLTETNGNLTHFHADGKLDFIQDINGNRITASINAAGQITSLSHSDGASLSFDYNAAGLISSLTSFATADHVGRTTIYSYDATSTFLMSATDSSGTTSYTYNNDGTNLASKYALLTTTDPSGVTQHFQYDIRGRLSARFTGNNLEHVTYSYDSAGGVTTTDAAGVSNKVYFDYRGLVVRNEDGLGNFTLFAYNPQRQLILQTDSLGNSIDYTRCDCGRPKTITDQLGGTSTFKLGGPNNDPTAFTDALGNVTQFGYDAHGNQSSTTYADGSVERITSDALGDPTTLVNRRGQSISIAYNSAGQISRETFPDGSSNIYTYDTRGRMATASNSQGTTTFTYNSADDLTRVDYPDNRFLIYQYRSFQKFCDIHIDIMSGKWHNDSNERWNAVYFRIF